MAMLRTTEEAIALLLSRGFHAQPWGFGGPNTFAAASERVDAGNGIHILTDIVIVEELAIGWHIRAEDARLNATASSLEQAVEVAARIVSQLRAHRQHSASRRRSPAP